jgi:hypothetical protein
LNGETASESSVETVSEITHQAGLTNEIETIVIYAYGPCMQIATGKRILLDISPANEIGKPMIHAYGPCKLQLKKLFN